MEANKKDEKPSDGNFLKHHTLPEPDYVGSNPGPAVKLRLSCFQHNSVHSMRLFEAFEAVRSFILAHRETDSPFRLCVLHCF